jgi:agmatinase
MNPLPFLGLEGEFSDLGSAKIIVLPIGLEKTTSYQKGTKNAPTAILKASDQLEFYDAYFGQQSCRVGIGTDRSMDCRPSLKENVDNIYQRALHWWEQDKFPFFIGGEHSVSIGVFKALKEIYGPVTILQIDAHADLRPDYHGNPYSHASVMARARDEGHKIVQCAVRSLGQEEAEKIKSDADIHCFFDHDQGWKKNGFEEVIEKIEGPCYLTIDVDGFDPGEMPATGTPVPGGLNWKELNELIENLFDKAEVLGADLCELRPRKEFKHCDFYCATLIYRIMGHKVIQAGWELKGQALPDSL